MTWEPPEPLSLTCQLPSDGWNTATSVLLSPSKSALIGDDEAIEQLRELSEDDPEFAVANSFISRASEMKEDYDTALDAQVKRSQSQGSSPETIGTMRSKYAAQGWPGVLRFIVDLPEGPEKSQIGGGAVHLAAMYCRLGEFEKAYEALEKGFKQRNAWMIHLGRDPRFDSMRNDARFTELLARIGLK